MSVTDEVSIAAGDRLLIMDTKGEVPEDKLLQFYMEHVEPVFQHWWESQKRSAGQPAAERGGIRAMQDEGPSRAKPVKPAEPTVLTPQPDFVGIVCKRCGGHITWNLALGLAGYCPHCGDYIQLVIS